MTGRATKRARPEQDLHRAVVQFLELALPRDAVWFHVPNGERRDQKIGAILAGLRVKPGVPDILILYRGRLHCIELKGSRGRLTAAQKDMHAQLWFCGATVRVCRTLEEVETAVREFAPLRSTVMV